MGGTGSGLGLTIDGLRWCHKGWYPLIAHRAAVLSTLRHLRRAAETWPRSGARIRSQKSLCGVLSTRRAFVSARRRAVLPGGQMSS